MHCEGIMSGELKHGPLAMVDKDKTIIMIICKDHVYTVELEIDAFLLFRMYLFVKLIE